MYGRGDWRPRRNNDYDNRNERDRRWQGSDTHSRWNKPRGHGAYSHNSIRNRHPYYSPHVTVPPPPPPRPPRLDAAYSDGEEEKAKKQKAADMVKHKLLSLTEEDKSSSIKELLDEGEIEPKCASSVDEKDSKRIAHVPKAVIEGVQSNVPGPIPPPPPLPFMLTQHLDESKEDFGQKAVQKRIERKLLLDLVRMPLLELKAMASKPKAGDNLFLSHLMKETRLSLSENFRKLAEKRLQKDNPQLQSVLEDIIDADIAADMSRLSSETIQTLSDIFNLNLDGDIMSPYPDDNVACSPRGLLTDIKTEMETEFYDPSSPTQDASFMQCWPAPPAIPMNLQAPVLPVPLPVPAPSPPVPLPVPAPIPAMVFPTFPAPDSLPVPPPIHLPVLGACDPVPSPPTHVPLPAPAPAPVSSAAPLHFTAPILSPVTSKPTVPPSHLSPGNNPSSSEPLGESASNIVFQPIQTNASFLPAVAQTTPTFLGTASPAPTVSSENSLKSEAIQDPNARADEISDKIKRAIRMLEESKKQQSETLKMKIKEKVKRSKDVAHRKHYSHKHGRNMRNVKDESQKQEHASMSASSETELLDSHPPAPKPLSLSEKLKVLSQAEASKMRTVEKPKVKMLNMHSQTIPPLRMNRGTQFPINRLIVSNSSSQTVQRENLRDISSQTQVASASIEVQTTFSKASESKSTQTVISSAKTVDRAVQNDVVLLSTRGIQVNSSFLSDNKSSSHPKPEKSSTTPTSMDEDAVLIKTIAGSALADDYKKLYEEIKSTSSTSVIRAQLVKHLLPVLNGAFKSMYSFFSLYDQSATHSKNLAKGTSVYVKSEKRSGKSSHKEKERSPGSVQRKHRKEFKSDKEVSSSQQERSRSPSADTVSVRSLQSEASTKSLAKKPQFKKIVKNEPVFKKTSTNHTTMQPLNGDVKNENDEPAKQRNRKRERSLSECSEASKPPQQEKAAVVERKRPKLGLNRPCPASKKKRLLSSEDREGADIGSWSETDLDHSTSTMSVRDDSWYKNTYSLKECRVMVAPLPKTPTYEAPHMKEKIPAAPIRRSSSSCSDHCSELGRPHTPNWTEKCNEAIGELDRGSDDERATTTCSDQPCDDAAEMRHNTSGPMLFHSHHGPVSDLKISGNHLLVASMNPEVVCYSLKNGKRKRLYQTKNEVVCMSVLPSKEGQVVFCACADQTIRAFSVQTSELLRTSESLKGIPRCMDASGTFSRNGVLYVGLDTGECISLNPKVLKVMRRLRGNVEVIALLSISIDENLVVVVSSVDRRLMIRNFNAVVSVTHCVCPRFLSLSHSHSLDKFRTGDNIDLLQKLEWDSERPAERLLFHQGFLYCAARLPYIVSYGFNKQTGWSAPTKIVMPDNAISLCAMQSCLLAVTTTACVLVVEQGKSTVIGDLGKEGSLASVGLYRKRIICVYEDGRLISCLLPIEIRTTMRSLMLSADT